MSEQSEKKKPLVPRLRFPEFQGAGEWAVPELQEISVPVDERVGDRHLIPVSISAGIGFVAQAEKFGRDISGSQYRMYTVVRDGDFVYNKGNSLKFPQGCIYDLQGWGEVAAPNVFICFRLKSGYENGFFRHCFEKNTHGLQLKKHITSGARSNGLLNISREAFFGVKIPSPTQNEQKKIADCLTSLDELILEEARKLEIIKIQKKSLIQLLLPCEGETVPRLRFPEFEGSDEWEIKSVGDVFRVTRGEVLAMPQVKDVPSEGFPYPVYSSQTKNNGLAGYFSEYLFKDAITWTTDGANAGEVKFRKGEFFCTNVCGVLLNGEGWANPFVAALLNSVSRKYVSYVGNPKLMNGVMSEIAVPFPCLPEQLRIAELLVSIDDMIAFQVERIDVLKTHKKGLMQQLIPAVVDEVGS